MPSDGITRSEGPARLGASFPEDGNRADFRNVGLFFLKKTGQCQKKKDCVR